MNAIYTITGKVIEGKKRGRLLGFPTINVKLDQEVESGIYASYVYVDDERLLAATFIGEAKTFGEEDYKLESYILDFDRDIYGETVRVELYKKLRDNEKYSNSGDLIAKIKEDVQQTIYFFTSSGSL
ncbi:MAG: riboflavin kinase [Microgenomates group bacterium]